MRMTYGAAMIRSINTLSAPDAVAVGAIPALFGPVSACVAPGSPTPAMARVSHNCVPANG
jgi:hypothetical protein